MNYVVLTIGKTHSGKTTFGKILKKKLPEYVIIETDPIGEIVNQNYQELSDDKEHDGKFDRPSLKYKLFLNVLEHAIDLKKNIILTNSNMHIKGREDLINLFGSHNYKLIFVYLDMPQKLLQERVESTDRSKAILQTAKSFEEVLQMQNDTRFKEPNGDEGDYFITLNSPDEFSQTAEKIVGIVS